MKVTTDSCLFGAWCAYEIQKLRCSRILDIGTGTGLLSLMIAQKNNASIDAVELDKNAAFQASENVISSLWKENISVYHSDIKEHIGNYDCIISNPPFYENELQSPDIRNNIAHHSLRLTLLDLIQYSKKSLTDNGYLFLLLPYKRLTEIERLFCSEKLSLQKIVIVKPSTNLAPFRVMMLASRKRNREPEVEYLSIKNEQDYTDDFISLLKDYYLYL